MCCKYCNDKFFAIPRCFRWRSLRCRIWQETHTPVQAPSSASPKLPACTSSSQSKCRSPFHLDLLVLRLFLFLCLFLLTQLSQVRIKSVCFHLCVCVCLGLTVDMSRLHLLHGDPVAHTWTDVTAQVSLYITHLYAIFSVTHFSWWVMKPMRSAAVEYTVLVLIIIIINCVYICWIKDAVCNVCGGNSSM